jgi:single-strand DNA-binding protein
MYNRSILAGHLCRNPEQRFTPKGKPVANFSVASNRVWVNEAGERKDECTFVECTAWGRTAEVIAQYFRKGDPILVEGELRLDQWEHEGQKRTKLFLLVDRFTFLKAKDKGGVDEGQRAVANRAKHDDDDLPF